MDTMSLGLFFLYEWMNPIKEIISVTSQLFLHDGSYEKCFILPTCIYICMCFGSQFAHFFSKRLRFKCWHCSNKSLYHSRGACKNDFLLQVLSDAWWVSCLSLRTSQLKHSVSIWLKGLCSLKIYCFSFSWGTKAGKKSLYTLSITFGNRCFLGINNQPKLLIFFLVCNSHRKALQDLKSTSTLKAVDSHSSAMQHTCNMQQSKIKHIHRSMSVLELIIYA